MLLYACIVYLAPVLHIRVLSHFKTDTPKIFYSKENSKFMFFVFRKLAKNELFV